MTSYGLGPDFRQKLCQDIPQLENGYPFQYDEAGNSQGRKQCANGKKTIFAKFILWSCQGK